MSSLKKNVLLTFFTDVSNLGFGILSSIITARWLGPEGKGIFAFVTLVPGIIVMLGNFGIAQSATYFIGQNKYDKDEVFNNIIIWLLISGTALASISLATLYSIPKFIYRDYLVILIPTIYFQLGSRLLLGSLLGQQKINEYNQSRLVKSISLLVLYICFIVFLGWEVKGALFAWLLSNLLEFCFILIKAYPRNYSIKLTIRRSWLKESLNYGKKIYLSNLVNFINYRIDRLLIISFLNPFQLGLYSVASNLAEKIWMIPDAISTVLFPKVSSKNKNDASNITKVISSVTVGLALLFSTLMIFIGSWIINTLFGTDFKDAFLPFAILVIGTAPFSLFKVIAAYFSGIGKQSYVLRITIIISTVNVIMNLFLIPRYGIIGASLSSSISYSLGGALALYWASRISGYSVSHFLSFWKIKNIEKATHKRKGGLINGLFETK